MKERKTERKSKRLAPGDIPSIASIFFIANSTSRRDAASCTRAPGTINDSYGIPSGAHGRIAINDSDKMNRVGGAASRTTRCLLARIAGATTYYANASVSLRRKHVKSLVSRRNARSKNHKSAIKPAKRNVPWTRYWPKERC